MDFSFNFIDDRGIQRLTRLAWRAFILVTVADFLTTYAALAVGNDEDNVLIAWVLDLHGFVGFAVVKVAVLLFVYGGIQYIKPWKPRIAFYLLAGGTAAGGLVVATNIVAAVALFLYG